MKGMKNKRSPAKKADEGSRLLGTGAAGKAGNAIKDRRNRVRGQMDEIMGDLKKGRR